MTEEIISPTPAELSCMVGNLFAELEPPCDVPFAPGLTLCGITPAGNRAVLLVHRDFCIFRGEAGDLEAARRSCLNRRGKSNAG